MRDGGGGVRRRRHPEVVADHQTGAAGALRQRDPEFFETRLAVTLRQPLVAELERARQYGEAGRQRCIEEFSWAHIAEQTLADLPEGVWLAGDALGVRRRGRLPLRG